MLYGIDWLKFGASCSVVWYQCSMVRWYGISVRWYGVVWYQCSMVRRMCFSAESRFGMCFHSECHFVMYSFGALLCDLVASLCGSFRSSASVVMRSSASVCVTCRSLFRVTCGVVLRVSLVFAVRCGIEVVFLTFIVHVSSVVVVACRAPLEVDNPLV